MALLTKAPRGTHDIMPSEIYKYHFLEEQFFSLADAFGFKEIRTPVFEHTELFRRSVGETTDVVQKEMYTFDDLAGRSITLRPEGTAGVARAFVEHGIFNEPAPQKFTYLTSCYRYEKPQAGRLREFHQFGVETFGAADARADAEIVALADCFFESLGVEDIHLEINSIGCPECRKVYLERLRSYFESKKDILCETCKGRLDRNPMRILDCKSPVCATTFADAPVTLDSLCEPCAEHFEAFKANLEALGVEYRINPMIVRGLDYYTRSVFEFVSDKIGAQGSVCGGGRYDGLIEEIGGPHTPACGFGMGVERLVLLLDSIGFEFPEPGACALYIASTDAESARVASQIALDVRLSGISAEYDITGRSLKAQMKYANKLNAEFTIVLGTDELNSGIGKLKDMKTGETVDVKLSEVAEAIVDIYSNMILNQYGELAGLYPDENPTPPNGNNFTIIEGGKKK